MAETPDQARPLAPAAEDGESPPTTTDADAAKSRRRGRRLKCCGLAAALLLVHAAVAVALALTVFRVRDPIIRMNAVSVERLDPIDGRNMTLIADVSVRNPNFASFRYGSTTTSIHYRGAVVGEARGPPGRAAARRTARMNLTVEVMADRVLSRPDLGADLSSGLVTMSSYTVVGGRVRVMMIGRHVTVRMNCSVTVNVTSRAIQEQRCRRKVKL